MPQRIVRRSKYRKFSHAAAAMGAFWERARQREARRIEELHRALVEAPARLTGSAPLHSVARPLAR
jgi:hypothetical protein